MTTTAETTSYAVEGRLLEVCTCNVLCPCWVGEDPDGDGTCDSILGWYVDRGTVDGRRRLRPVPVPVRAHPRERARRELAGRDAGRRPLHATSSSSALLDVFTGRLGGPIADSPALDR